MKIGIVTFHFVHNYGAVLQCYALKEYLKNIGYDVDVINYKPKDLFIPYRIYPISWSRDKFSQIIKTFITATIKLPISITKYRHFNNFINKLTNNKKVVSEETFPSDYDCYILGSDQLWNIDITMGENRIYLGDFNRKKNSKLIAYAISTGKTSLSKIENQIFSYSINRFDYFSFRERSMTDYFINKTSKKIFNAIDPTLLVNRTIWEKIIQPITLKPYVLIYQITELNESYSLAKSIAQKYNLDIIEIDSNIHIQKKHNGHIMNASPEKFVSLLSRASYIITTSFHGTAFSIIFRRQFYTLYNSKGMNSRIDSLLEELGLKNRSLNINNLNTFNETFINYSLLDDKIESLKDTSYLFFAKALKNG